MNVRKLTLEYFSGKFIPNDSSLSEQFQNQMEERDKIDTPNIQNIYIL